MRSAYSQPETPLRASNPSPTSNSWKSVNRFVRVQTSVDFLISHLTCDCTTRRSSVGDLNRKWHTEDPSSNPQTVPSPPSSAARVRPLLRQRRHRLIRLEECTALKSKVKRILSISIVSGLLVWISDDAFVQKTHLCFSLPQPVLLQCSCEPPAVCVLCAGAPPRAPSDRQKGAWMRQTWLDMSVHPVLSAPSGNALWDAVGKILNSVNLNV